MKSMIVPSSSSCSLLIFSFSLIILLKISLLLNDLIKLKLTFLVHTSAELLLEYLPLFFLPIKIKAFGYAALFPDIREEKKTKWRAVNLLLSLFPLLKSHFSHQLLWTVTLKETHGLNLQVLDFFVRPIELWIIRIELNRIELNLSVWGGSRIKEPRHGSGFSRWCVLSCWCFLWAAEPE